jgi:hypothetical protein
MRRGVTRDARRDSLAGPDTAQTSGRNDPTDVGTAEFADAIIVKLGS